MNLPLRRALAAVAVLAVAPAVASCGFDYPTDQVYTPAVGVNDRDGNVDALNVVIISEKQGTGSLIAGLVSNRPSQPDRLTSIEGTAADASLSFRLDAPVRVPAGGLTQLADTGGVPVTGDQIVPGLLVRLRMTFAHAAPVELNVPVVAMGSEFGDFTPSPLPAGISPGAETPATSPETSPSGPSESPSPTG